MGIFPLATLSSISEEWVTAGNTVAELKFTRLQCSCSLLPPSCASRKQLSGVTAKDR